MSRSRKSRQHSRRRRTEHEALWREPTLWIAVINAAVILGATLGFNLLDNEQAGLIVAAINALFAAANAWAVRPISPAVPDLRGQLHHRGVCCLRPQRYA